MLGYNELIKKMQDYDEWNGSTLSHWVVDHWGRMPSAQQCRGMLDEIERNNWNSPRHVDRLGDTLETIKQIATGDIR